MKTTKIDTTKRCLTCTGKLDWEFYSKEEHTEEGVLLCPHCYATIEEVQ